METSCERDFMIDVKLLLGDFEALKAALLIKKVEPQLLERTFCLANQYKSTLKNLEALKARQNAESKLFFQYKKEKRPVDDLALELGSLKAQIADLEAVLEAQKNELDSVLLQIPNPPDSKTPRGEDERDNVELARILSPKPLDFAPKEHWDLAAANKWIDFSAGVKLAKSRFSVLRNEAARLNRALINFMLDFNAGCGFCEVTTPVIVNEESLFATGQLPKFKDDMFRLEGVLEEDSARDLAQDSRDSRDFAARDSLDSQDSPLLSQKDSPQKGQKKKGHELYLISTAEITLTNLYRDTIIPKDELPIMLCAYTPCFRKEAGSAGRDTRGMIRQHQFDKVELVAITLPEKSDEMQEKMLTCASGILKALELPHRFIQLCGGDLGFSAANTIDIEVWLPGQGCYREISSISNVRDFQARRGAIRYKDGKKNLTPHTLNGSSLAVGRTLVAIMENHQNADGTIKIPAALEKYMA